jgi:hypothetical protein
MHAPDFRDRRLPGDTIRRLDAFAAAEESGSESMELAEAVIAELSSTSPFGVTALERAVRDAYRYAPYREPKRQLTLAERFTGLFAAPTEAPRLPPSRPGQWLRLMHPNGYVREAVLQAIDGPPPASIFLAALLLALNDHVPQVRDAARQCLERLQDATPTAVISATVPYIVTRWPNWANASDREASFGILKREDVLASIRLLLTNSNAAWLPRFFRDLLASDIADAWLVDLATEARHPAIRARSTLVLVEGQVDRLVEFRSLWRNPLRNPVRAVKASFDASTLISAGARDRTVAVRKAAAEGLVRHYRTLPDVELQLAAFADEKNVAIRNRLDFIRRQLAAV